MYIGLYDDDLNRGLKTNVPSLELMKLSSREGDFVEYIESFDNYKKYDMVFYKKDASKMSESNMDIFIDDKIIPIGTGFSGKFIPLDVSFDAPLLDKNFYRVYFRTHRSNFSVRKNAIWNKILENEDYIPMRVSNNGIKLPDYDRVNFKNKKIILYDYDFFKNSLGEEFIRHNLDYNNQISFLNYQSCSNFDTFKLAYSLNLKNLSKNAPVVGYSQSLSKKMFLNNYTYFNNYFIFEIPILNFKDVNYQRQTVGLLMTYFNYIMYIYSKGGQTYLRGTVQTHDLESSMLSYLVRFSKMVGKTGGDFLTFCKNYSKISKENTILFLKKYPYLEGVLSAKVKDVVKQGVWYL